MSLDTNEFLLLLRELKESDYENYLKVVNKILEYNKEKIK